MKIIFAAEPKDKSVANDKDARKGGERQNEDQQTSKKDPDDKQEGDMSQELDFMRKNHHEKHWHF